MAATNLPVHHVEGPTAAVQEAVEAVQAVEAEPEVIDAYKGEEVMTPQVQYSYLPYAQNYEYYGAASNSAPAPAVETTYSHVPAAPIVTPVVTPVAQVVQPVSADGSQYHAQDDLGKKSNQRNEKLSFSSMSRNNSIPLLAQSNLFPNFI